jgi:hypothetical protein
MTMAVDEKAGNGCNSGGNLWRWLVAAVAAATAVDDNGYGSSGQWQMTAVFAFDGRGDNKSGGGRQRWLGMII